MRRIMRDNCARAPRARPRERRRAAARGRTPSCWDEVTAWLEEHWDPDLTVDAWWKAVAAAGLDRARTSPAEQGGRGLQPPVAGRGAGRVRRLRRPAPAGRPRPADGRADDPHPGHARADRPAASRRSSRARSAWCQLFSEPGAGSDLAGLTTRAAPRRRPVDHHRPEGVVEPGHARPTTGCCSPAPTSTCPKHKGISWFAFRLDQPGVTIRPLREMTGDAVFNEVFLDDAVVRRRRPHRRRGQRLGGHPDHAALRAHRHRRRRRATPASPSPGPKGGMLGRRAGDAALDEAPNAKLTVGYADVVELAQRARPRPTTRTSARTWPASTPTPRSARWNAQRGKAEAAARAAARRSPASASSPRPAS